ncbi:hypothetical protein LXM25_21705 [Dyadobacter sp. LJ53]|nr:Arm DNA-binding domain-containing protein [Dyadobacter chenwenxiniae]MCF0052702.1 hypothetical protein [Dyadobacter chenwenxiniae]
MNILIQQNEISNFKTKKMESSMTILFSVRQSKINRNNQLPVYMRVTIGGERFEVAPGKSVSPERWSASFGKAKGATIEAKEVNAFLESLAGKAYAIQWQIILEDLIICIDVFKRKWQGEDQNIINNQQTRVAENLDMVRYRGLG